MGVFSLAAFLLLCLGTLVVPSQGSDQYIEVSNPNLNQEVIKVASKVLEKRQSALIGCQLRLITVKRAWLKTEPGKKAWKILMEYHKVWRTGQALTVLGRFDVEQKTGAPIKITKQHSVISGHNVTVGHPSIEAKPIVKVVQDVVEATFNKMRLYPEHHGCLLKTTLIKEALSTTEANVVSWKLQVVFEKTCPYGKFLVRSTFLVLELPPKGCNQPSGVQNVCIGDIHQYIYSAKMVDTGTGSPAIGAPGGYLQVKNPNQDQRLKVVIDDALKTIFGNGDYTPESIADAAWKKVGNDWEFAVMVYVTLGGQHSLPNRILLFLKALQTCPSKKGCVSVRKYELTFEELLKTPI